jgi:uncharacterized protein YciI
MVGAFADLKKDGTMAIFANREAAEEFVREDPFILNGVVKSYRILDWDESLTG